MNSGGNYSTNTTCNKSTRNLISLNGILCSELVAADDQYDLYLACVRLSTFSSNCTQNSATFPVELCQFAF